MITNKTEHRVTYADTDHGGVAYYAAYLIWFEIGRTELLRESGSTFSELEKQGFIAPVVEIKVNYLKPAQYDDVIVLETSIENIGNSSIKFVYKLLNKNNELIAEGYTVNVFVKDMKPVRVPDSVRKNLE